MPNRLAKSIELVPHQQRIPPPQERETYVDGGVVSAGTGKVADGVEIMIVLVPAYIVLV